MIVRSIMQDSVSSIEGNNMFDSVFHRDFDVNKLYFLMYRLLKSALNDSNVASTFGLTNSEVLGNWFLAVNLENIADNSKKICEVLKKKIKVNIKEKAKQAANLYSKMKFKKVYEVLELDLTERD